MDIAGLTVGAAALIGTFKDCIDLYSMISAAGSLGKDAALLETKLDVEKMLFFQWADRVGLVNPREYDARLDEPALNKTVARVLSSIKDLLGEGNALQSRYGLARCDLAIDRTSLDDVDAAKPSALRMERFLRNFEQLGLTTNTPKANTEAKGFSVKDRWCWVVRDKDKFEQLIQELSHLNSRLHDLVPDKANARSILALTEEDLSDIRSIPHLKLISEAAPGIPHVLEAVRRAIQTANQNRVLQRLWFRQIDDRRETVSGAHAGTFSWALCPPKRALEWDDLCDWLRAEKSGIYWLAGKAGSGKSTLMKYVLGHSRTQELLKEWAGASDFTVADFFFYHLGMPEQKSQEGLFQGLLYQVLSQHRDCIETVMPKMWWEALATEDDPKGEISMPSVREMQTGLLDFAKSQPGKLFLLIDGLDEYDGRPMDAATFIEELGKLEIVKILVSSRPLPDFAAAFQGKPKMNLQDLTRRDIETYVDDTITHHPYMTKLALEDPNGSSELVRDFISKASGVFLWVILACRSVLEGFAAFDSVSDLKARVHELPPELEELFRHMLHRIDPRCREQSVRLLRLVFDNQTKEDACPIPTLGLALGERRDFRYDLGEPSTSDLSIDQKRVKCQMMEGRLRSRCYGLVEIQRVTLANEPNMLCVCDNNKEHDLFLDSSVVFMHRSVYEFLGMPDVWDSEWMQIDHDGFHSHAILSTLWIEVAGMGQQRNMAHKNICINNALLHIYSSELDGDPPSIVAANLSRLQSIFQGSCYGPFWDEARQGALHQARCRHFNHDLSIGLALAAEMGMESLLKFAIEQPKDLAHCLCPREETWLRDCTGASRPGNGKEMAVSGCQPVFRVNRDRFGLSPSQITGLPLLYHATCRPLLQHLQAMNLGFQNTCPGVRGSETVRYLLGAGCDPNEQFIQPNGNQETSPWLCWLRCIGDGLGQSGWKNPEASLDGAQITLQLLGADADLGVSHTEPSSQPQNVISGILKQALNRGPSQFQAWEPSDRLWAEVKDEIYRRLVPKGGPSPAANSLNSPNLLLSIYRGRAGGIAVMEKNSRTPERESDEERFWACPFDKFGPLQHQRCGQLQFKSVAYVLQHVSREHVKRHDSVMRVEGRYGAKYELVEDDYQLIRHAVKGKRAEVDKWYAMWDILYPDKPRPSSPFKDGLLEQMLAIARDAHRFYLN
ncbi:hypothetical protein CEP51_012153 [Fusarium floridanum]|uniref:Prion-inhibition and propagation HeLo domain-containing protein n=1 Tax=Fusarium floridanum TaxID=1325733 RepID=A0A428QZA0_9HYPO|nr:hypothetical protein CEP51_012153 [Fusarium floridanum]